MAAEPSAEQAEPGQVSLRVAKDLAMAAIGGKWKVAILWELLHEEPLRLRDLERSVPEAGQRMLIRQLRELEEGGLVERTVYPVVPPRVEYRLTPIGRQTRQLVTEICAWGERYAQQLALG